MMKKTLLFAIVSSAWYMSGQTLVSTSGGVYQDDGLKITWTLGESRVDQKTTPEFSISEGQQEGDIGLLTLIEELDESVQIQVFPNPTSSQVKLISGGSSKLEFQLINQQGEVLEIGDFSESRVLSLGNYSDGLYFIRLKNTETQKTNSYNIIKN